MVESGHKEPDEEQVEEIMEVVFFSLGLGLGLGDSGVCPSSRGIANP